MGINSSGNIFRYSIVWSDVIVGLLVCVLLPASASADLLTDSKNNPRIDELVITGVRERPLAELPRSANIITAEDIALSPADNIVDLLAREANLNLRSFYGNAKFSGVDIRGQGDTYRSNVLVMVDGIQLNSADLSGADYSSIPLDRVKRIEVIRGANTVRYGSGAVSGVINIITDSSQPGARMNIKARTGSDSTREIGFGASNTSEIFSAGASASYYDTDGYRDNGGLETKDIAANLGITPVNWFSATVRGSLHHDEYGMPGGVSWTDFSGSDSQRRSTSHPDDNGETDDDHARLDLSFGTDTTGKLGITGSLRDRDNRYLYLPPTPDATSDEIHEDDTRVESQYDKTFNLFGHEHDFSLGLDLVQTDYRRDVYNYTPGIDSSKQGDIRQTAWFVAGDFELHESLKLSLGYRSDRFTNDGSEYKISTTLCDDPGVFIPPPPGLPTEICNDPGGFRTGLALDSQRSDTWRNSAVEAGLVLKLSDETNFFVSYAQSFRNPNVDELILATADLGPQTADHLDAGVRTLLGASAEWSFSVFYSRTEDEILFALPPGSILGVNFNAPEPTRRVGGETDVRWYVLPTLMLSANAGYTHARFTGINTEVPLVPEWTGGAGLQWQPVIDWTLNVSGTYVGKRYNGNDFSNTQFRELHAYKVVDTRLSYEFNHLQVYAEANNVFDEVYAATAYGESYYPMPGRNYFAGITYRM